MQKPLLPSASHAEKFKNVVLKKTKRPFLGMQVGLLSAGAAVRGRLSSDHL